MVSLVFMENVVLLKRLLNGPVMHFHPVCVVCFIVLLLFLLNPKSFHVFKQYWTDFPLNVFF